MDFEIEVSSPWFELIRDGKKSVEGRKGTPRWLRIRPGMTGLIINSETREWFSVTCTGVKTYADIRTYLLCEGIERALPGLLAANQGSYQQAIECGVEIYSQWWTPAEVQEYGVLAIQIAL